MHLTAARNSQPSIQDVPGEVPLPGRDLPCRICQWDDTQAYVLVDFNKKNELNKSIEE